MSEIAYHEKFTENGEYDVQVYEHKYMKFDGSIGIDTVFGDFYKKGEKPTHYEYDVAQYKHIGVAHITLKFDRK